MKQAEEAQARNSVSYHLGAYGVNLPSALSLTRDQVAYVSVALKDTIPKC